MKILVVDDSIAYRKTISKILSNIEGVEIVGEAANGSIAIQKLKQQSIDLITLDMEMPILNGLETLEKIKELDLKTKAIIFASQSKRGAKIAVEAFKLGAVDIIPKPDRDYDSINMAYDHVRDLLLPRIIAFRNQEFKDLKKKLPHSADIKKATEALLEIGKNKAEAKPKPSVPRIKVDLETIRPRIAVIGSSTGGPSALEKIFESINGIITVPILIAQHMPPVFTKSLAERIGKITGIPCDEALNGEKIKPKIYFAPGDYHMEVIKDKDNTHRIKLHQGPKINNVRPAVDALFNSVARLFGNKTFGLVLTGMGADGAEGCTTIKDAGGSVMIQDKSSSIVWGMPGAVHDLGCFDKMGDLSSCTRILKKAVKPLTEA